MIASTCFSLAFLTLVSTLPLNGTHFRSFLVCITCAILLRLEVPTVAPFGSSESDFASVEVTSASSTRSLFGMAAIFSPSVIVVGRSFRL